MTKKEITHEELLVELEAVDAAVHNLEAKFTEAAEDQEKAINRVALNVNRLANVGSRTQADVKANRERLDKHETMMEALAKDVHHIRIGFDEMRAGNADIAETLKSLAAAVTLWARQMKG